MKFIKIGANSSASFSLKIVKDSERRNIFKMKRLHRYIYGSAMRRRDLADWVEDRTFPVMDVLAQLYLFPNTEYENHWRGELYAAWNRVKLLKGSKLPSKEFLIQSTFGVNKHSASRILQSMVDKEYELKPRVGYNVETYLELCEDYFEWLCDILSKHQIVVRSEVYSKLDEMGL